MTDVRQILHTVRDRGAVAVADYTKAFDQVSIPSDQLLYDPFAIDVGLPSDAVREAIDVAIRRIRRFHRATRPSASTQLDSEYHLSLSERWIPLKRVGVYAPNGGYPLVSSLLMTAVPAQEAGVQDLVVAISPRNDSHRHPVWNYALRQLNLHKVLRAGGAQAIAAMGYGMAGLDPVDLIAGPGNRYVTEAKQILSAEGVVGIDLVAGPSEVLVVADGTARADWVALDLLSQAEHAADASAIFVTWDAAFLDRVRDQVDTFRRSHPDHAIGTIRYDLVADPEAALARLNQVAPEHAGLVGALAEALAPRVETAGALFVGAMAGQALGDYVAGPSHVLPTAGTGRFLSGLSTRTFMRRMSVIEAPAQIPSSLLEHGATLAELEGLTFHGQALLSRRA